MLFSTFPAPAGNPDAQRAAYALALKGHEAIDVEAAIMRFIRGEVEWHNKAFAPSASLLGGEVNACRNERLESARRARPVPSAPPSVGHSPDSRDRVRALVKQFEAKHSSRTGGRF